MAAALDDETRNEWKWDFKFPTWSELSALLLIVGLLYYVVSRLMLERFLLLWRLGRDLRPL